MLVISVAKSAAEKIGALIRFMKLPSSEIALYLYITAMQTCMEYCCHVWAGATSFCLDLLDKLQVQCSGPLFLQLLPLLSP